MSIKLKQLILSSVFLLMVGCASEPMIKLSEENQSIIDAKKQAKEGESNGTDSAEGVNAESESGQEGSAESVEEVEEAPQLATFDTSEWLPLEEGAWALTLDQYLPNITYQIKQFGNGSQSRVDYVNFLDEASQSMQVESRVEDTVQLIFYQWDASQIVQVGESTTVSNPYINQLPTLTRDAEADTILLQAPLQVGTSWQANPTTTSEITNIYQQASLASLEFENVIEVTSTSQTGQQLAYYAAGEGLIGLIESNNEGDLTQVWQAQTIYHDNRIINDIEVMVPTQEDSMIESSTAAFRWQTNSNYAAPFDSMLKELNILDETITVNSVGIENNVATIDFTPGVVAVLNSYDAPEQAVIAAIVTTVGNFFDTDQVRLTVSGTGMLPDTIEYPTNGIYQVSTVTQALATTSQTEGEMDNASDNESSQSADSSVNQEATGDESVTNTMN